MQSASYTMSRESCLWVWVFNTAIVLLPRAKVNRSHVYQDRNFDATRSRYTENMHIEAVGTR